MTQATNNRILLKTVAFCAVVAGIGALPAMAEIDTKRTWEQMQQERRDEIRRGFERFLLEQKIRNEIDRRFEQN